MSQINDIAAKWNHLLSIHKSALRITDLDYSALNSWVIDCFESHQNIYGNLFEKITQLSITDPNQLDQLHDSIVEMLFELIHIKNHIEASETGMNELIRVLAEQGD